MTITYNTNHACTSKSMTEWYFGKQTVANHTATAKRMHKKSGETEVRFCSRSGEHRVLRRWSSGEMSEIVADMPPMSNDAEAQAAAFKSEVIPAMEALRECVDRMESRVSKEKWPYPSYGRLLNRV